MPHILRKELYLRNGQYMSRTTVRNVRNRTLFQTGATPKRIVYSATKKILRNRRQPYSILCITTRYVVTHGTGSVGPKITNLARAQLLAEPTRAKRSTLTKLTRRQGRGLLIPSFLFEYRIRNNKYYFFYGLQFTRRLSLH